MKTELQQQLFEKYPKIFRQKDLPMSETCMCWGLEIGEGWKDIIDNTCGLIQHHIDWSEQQLVWYNEKQQEIKNAIKEQRIQEYADAEFKFSEENKKRFLEMPLKYHKKPKVVKQVEAVQVKEKFGTLRFYTNGHNEFVDGVIQMAEAMSAVTCQDCGKPARVGGKGWISCLCTECRKDREYGNEVL